MPGSWTLFGTSDPPLATEIDIKNNDGSMELDNLGIVTKVNHYPNPNWLVLELDSATPVGVNVAWYWRTS